MEGDAAAPAILRPALLTIGARPVIIDAAAKTVYHAASVFASNYLVTVLDADAAALGWPAMHERLRALDPITAERLAPNDAQRINRALEICELSGGPMSALLAKRAKTVLPFELLSFALEPSDRAVLHARIATRFDLMLKNDALLDEVEQLRRRGDLHPGL